MILASAFADAFSFIPSHISLLLDKSLQTAELAFTALGIAVVLALPLGLWLGHRHRGLGFALGVSTLGRALPVIVVIGLLIAVINVGFWSITVALVIIGVPPILTNSYLAVDGIDRDVVEAARGMGLTERQILTGVELPLGLPLMLAGIRLGAVFVVATATVAGLTGYGGTLGDIFANQVTYHLAGTLAAAMFVAAIALLTAGVLALIQRAAYRRMAPRA